MSKKFKVKVTLDQDTCIACGTCGALMSDAFEYDDNAGKYSVTEAYKETTVDEETLKKLQEAASMCPTSSIKVEVVEEVK